MDWSQAHVSATVSPTGRQLSPAATAFATPTPCTARRARAAARRDPDRQVRPGLDARREDRLRSGPAQFGLRRRSPARTPPAVRPIVVWPCSLTRLYGPLSPRSAASSIQSARSRTSTYCSGSVPRTRREDRAAAGDPAAATTAAGRCSPRADDQPGPHQQRTVLAEALDARPAHRPAWPPRTGRRPRRASPPPPGVLVVAGRRRPGVHRAARHIDVAAERPAAAGPRPVPRDGAADQVSTTTSHSPSASAASPSGAVRSPSNEVAPAGASCRPRWKTVTSQPRASADSTTARPRTPCPPESEVSYRRLCLLGRSGRKRFC